MLAGRGNKPILNRNTAKTLFKPFVTRMKSRPVSQKKLDSLDNPDDGKTFAELGANGLMHKSKIADNSLFLRYRKSAWVKAMHGRGVRHSLKEVITNLPYKIWKSYIEAFIIPRYRPEWGRYIKWDAKIPPITVEERAKAKKGIAFLAAASQKSSKLSRQKTRNATPKKHHHHKKKYATDRPPRPVKHDHSECIPIRINVSGQLFEPQLRTLKQFPNTLLGDSQRMVQFYDPQRDEFFFDRHRSSFEAILYYYNTGGILRRSSGVNHETFLDEVKFFDLGPEVLSDLQHHQHGEVTNNILPMPNNLLKRKLWLLFEYPESSYQSRVVAYISILAVCMSIFEFCIETLPEYSIDKLDQVSSDDQRDLGVGGDDDTLDLKDPFFLTETICITFFVVEYMMRAATCPHLFNFIKEISNLIDLVAIMPYFLNILYFVDDKISGHKPSAGGELENKAISLTIFRLIRLVRVFRILKLSRHNRGLKILGKTLKASSRELGLLVAFLMVGVVVFSSAMFFVEAQYDKSPFTSIPSGFWFGVVTMTTLGYGDMVPIGPLGKIIGALCAIAGVLTISLPVPVIVSNFNMFYNSEEMNNPNATTSSNFPEGDHVEHCPYYPAWYSSDGQVVGDQLQGKSTDNNNAESYCVKWLSGDQKPDASDSDFDDLLVDQALKHGKIPKHQKKSRTSRRRSVKLSQRKIPVNVTKKAKPARSSPSSAVPFGLKKKK